jgi:hypothetical protein
MRKIFAGPLTLADDTSDCTIDRLFPVAGALREALQSRIVCIPQSSGRSFREQKILIE